MLMLLAAGGGGTAAQDETEVVLRDYDCGPCRIVAESTAFLGHPDDTVMISQQHFPAVDSRARFLQFRVKGR